MSETTERPPLDIHTWFSLTYANYLVLPRSVLQSMPEDWQHRFTALLSEMEGAFGGLEWPDYHVLALKREPEFMHVYGQCEQCEGDGTVNDEDCPACAGSGETDEVEDYRYETPEEVGFRDDPIPHYNRGRTRLEPRPITERTINEIAAKAVDRAT